MVVGKIVETAKVLSWLLELEVVHCDLILSGSLSYPTSLAVVKQCLPMAFMRWTEESES